MLLAKFQWKPAILFLAGFFFVCVFHLDGLKNLPGNVGDSRLNNLFLENIYLFLVGKSESLWTLPMFYPFPFTGGFSDNLFGASIFYVVPRFMNADPETSFQIWYLLGYLANFIGAYLALRQLGASPLGASFAAFIFAFSLNVSAHSGHVQLQWKFALPLALSSLILFLMDKNWNKFLLFCFFLVWQFYCSVYIGVFTLLLAIGVIVSYLLYLYFKKDLIFKVELINFYKNFVSSSVGNKLFVILGCSGLFLALMLLFYPYLAVSSMYGFDRSWFEIRLMLPRLLSYLVNDYSYLWIKAVSGNIANLPMRHEHNMFPGFITMVLAVIGIIWARDKTNHLLYWLMLGSFIFVIVSTLYISGFSFWRLFAELPLFSSIRAMVRIDLAYLFFYGFFVALVVSKLEAKRTRAASLVLVGLGVLMVLEAGTTRVGSFSKSEFRQRVEATMERLPSDLPEDSILFFAQEPSSPPWAAELDAMWASMILGKSTLNGYSGNFPLGFTFDFDLNCDEGKRRVEAYNQFASRHGLQVLTKDQAERVVPIGFGDCSITSQ